MTQRTAPFRPHRWHTLFIIVACHLGVWMHAQAQREVLHMRVMSYNVENLFDTEDDPQKNDNEFLPDATRHWDQTKYRQKLDDLAKVIIACGEWNPPALIGLCEVENERTMDDLTKYSALKAQDYRYIMTDSPDERGIDVALLYQRGVFLPRDVESLRVQPIGRKRPTRDILHVAGELPDGSLLDVFVTHLPSRSGGEKESEPYRIKAAEVIRHAVDSISQLRQRPQIIIMGDFNDHFTNRSVSEVLQAQKIVGKKADKHLLYDVLAAKDDSRKDYGSYRYQGEWQFLDHLLLSGTLLQRKGKALHVTNDRKVKDLGEAVSADVFAPDFVLEDDDRYGGKLPRRTYKGMRYHGGYSDHLPIYVDLELRY